MTMAPGHFQLYTHFTPALTAGDYKLTTTQSLSATGPKGGLTATDLPVDALDTYVTVTSPRYVLPPEQALSTYPPAGTEGAYGARLPQVVIKRRTLPWERSVAGAPADTPWLALVVFAEGEANVLSNVPVAQCVTAGLTLPGAPDVEKGSCLEIRKSMVDTIMPTQKDVPLLVHGRQVDLDDTELMMGDDDGYLAVVIANRLPLAVLDGTGKEVPVKYHACLVNLEGQWDRLLPQAPPHLLFSSFLVLDAVAVTYTQAAYDQQVMGMTTSQQVVLHNLPHDEAVGPVPLAAAQATAHSGVLSPETVAGTNAGTKSWVSGAAIENTTSKGQYVNVVGNSAIVQFIDPTLRFPVLLHWSFTSIGDTTFEKLMKSVDNGLLGTRGTQPVDPVGRPPLEVTETGHVGLDQRTRRGDLVRAWYRGPLLAHPADLDPKNRLPLAHTGDQLRAVIPDGREDLSLAAAFEIGRLLALSQPSMVSALLQWRQGGYQAARGHAIWDGIILDLGLEAVDLSRSPSLGGILARSFAAATSKSPGGVLGPPREITTAGTPMKLDTAGLSTVLTHFGLDVAADVPLPQLLTTLRATEVPRVSLLDLSKAEATKAMSGVLAAASEQALTQLVAGALSTQVWTKPGLPGGIIGGVPVLPHDDVAPAPGPDVLDEALHPKKKGRSR